MARFYVYALVDPTKHQPFYIGKGSNLRTEQHFTQHGDKFKTVIGTRTEDIEQEDQTSQGQEFSLKQQKLQKLSALGNTHADIARVVMQDLDESIAFTVESFLITFCYKKSDALDSQGLLNIQGGHHPERFRPYDHGEGGRWPLMAKFDLFDEFRRPSPPAGDDYYVYALIDPQDDKPFYVGKGKGVRLFDHFRSARQDSTGDAEDTEKLTMLRNILARQGMGESHIGRILARGLSEDEAFAVEALLIRYFYGFVMLTNQVEGQRGYRVRPKPNGCWKPLCGFDHPKVIDPNVRADREWLLNLYKQDGVHLPLELVCKQVDSVEFDEVKFLDSGDVAKEGDVKVDGKVVTRLKVFVRRKRLQVEARPRTVSQRRWMRQRFMEMGRVADLRNDGVFIPAQWRGAKNMTTDIDEAARRANAIVRFLTQLPGQAQLIELEKDKPDGPVSGALAAQLTEASEELPVTNEVESSPPPATDEQYAVAKQVYDTPALDEAFPVTEPAGCADKLRWVGVQFDALEFSEPLHVGNTNRMFVRALCATPIGLEDNWVWMYVYCGRNGMQCELRPTSARAEAFQQHLQDRLNIQIGREDYVFKFRNAPVSMSLPEIVQRIGYLIQLLAALEPDDLAGIPEEMLLRIQ